MRWSSGTTRHFLVYRNYDALLEYNCAHAYAFSVALLGRADCRCPCRTRESEKAGAAASAAGCVEAASPVK